MKNVCIVIKWGPRFRICPWPSTGWVRPCKQSKGGGHIVPGMVLPGGGVVTSSPMLGEKRCELVEKYEIAWSKIGFSLFIY